MLEIWQADADGRYAHEEDAAERMAAGNFFGFGRVPVNDRGEFFFTTIKPGSVEWRDGTPSGTPSGRVCVYARAAEEIGYEDLFSR